MSSREEEDDNLGRPEELMVNRYAKLRTATGNIANGLGVLALLWSTVVLLGGFVSVLSVKEFWYLTALSFIMACRMVDIVDNEMDKGIYMEEGKIISILRRWKWTTGGRRTRFCEIMLLRMVLVPKMILFICVGLFIQYSPPIILTASVSRLLERDYGIAGEDIENRAKLNAALDIFYALVAFQSLVTTYWFFLLPKLEFSVKKVASLTVEQGGEEKWGAVIVRMYYSETTSKLKKDGNLPGNWNLIAYSVGLLQSPSGDDHLWGARVLDKLFGDKVQRSSARHELLSSRISIQNLIGMIGSRGTGDNIENRERAARIVAHVASDLHITHFSGTQQCICSLLESCKQSCEPQITCQSENPDEPRHPEGQDQHGSLETSKNQDDAHSVLCIKDQTGDEPEQLANSQSAGFDKKKRTGLCDWIKKQRERIGFSNPKYRHPYESKGTKELISQGLMILEGLTQDEVNCTEISKDQRLLSRITEPLRSHDFLSMLQDNTMLELTVLTRLLKIQGDGATRLRQELASNMEAVSNLMGILETESESAQQLHEQALEILTELALASFAKPAFGESAFMLNKICENLEMFVEEKDGNTIAVEPDREKSLRLKKVRIKAKDALQRLLPFQSARIVKAAAKISKKDVIDRLTKLVDETLSGKTGTDVDAATRAGSSNSCATQKAGCQPLEEADSVQPPTQGNEEQYKGRGMNVISQQAFKEDMLFVAATMRVVNVTSEQDFTRPSPEDEALVKKVMEILEVNKGSTAEFFRILKVTSQVIVPMIQAVPSCMKYFNELNFKEELTEILKTMNDRKLPKFDVARVKKMKERLS